MKQTIMCIFSGFFGALFAVACGAIDGNHGVGGKSVYADGLTLTKRTFTCYGSLQDNQILENCSEYQDMVAREDAVFSMYFNGSYEDGSYTFQVIE